MGSSYLVRVTEDNGGKGHSLEIGVGTFTHNDDRAFALHTRALSVNADNRFALGYGRENVSLARQSNRAGQTYLIVARWEQKQNGRGKMWILGDAKAVNQVVGTNQKARLDAVALEAVTLTAKQAGQ